MVLAGDTAMKTQETHYQNNIIESDIAMASIAIPCFHSLLFNLHPQEVINGHFH